MPSSTHVPYSNAPFQRCLLISLWCGLCAGLVEGPALVILARLGQKRFTFAAVESVWISPLFNLLFFATAGLALMAVGACLRKAPPVRLCIFTFASLIFLDWLMLGRLLAAYAVVAVALGLAAAITRWFGRHEAAALAFIRRTLPWMAAWAALLLLVIEGGGWLRERAANAKLPPAAPGLPNVVLIVVDTLRADHLSAYGYSRRTSPNLDALARKGVLFEHAIATSSWTLPSHASMLTGLYPHEHGAQIRSFDARSPTLPGVLRERGYRTAAFSANDICFTRLVGFGTGFTRFEDFAHSLGGLASRTFYGRALEKSIWAAGLAADPRHRTAQQVNASALRWIARERSRPFFVMLNYMDVHEPYISPSSRLLERLLRGRFLPKTSEQIRREVAVYDAQIGSVDLRISELVDELSRRGLAGHTLVVVTSDHGQLFGEHGLFYHANALYLDLIHVPLLLFWPAHVPAGMRISTLASTAQLPATILELTGSDRRDIFPGPSLARLWRSGIAGDWPYPLSELAQFHWAGNEAAPNYRGSMASLVSPRWHYIAHQTLGEELYDWLRDPGEQHNLAGRAEAVPVMADFRQRMARLTSRESHVKAVATGQQPR